MLQHLEAEKSTLGSVTDPADTLNEQRAYRAELLCNHYRQAFLHMLKEDFTDLDSTLRRMLEVLSTTLDVDRVSLWSFENNNAIRCTMEFSRGSIAEPHPSTLLKSDFPNYFAAISQQLVIAADDAENDLRTKELTARYLKPLGIKSMLDVPVRAFGRYVGILCHEQIEGQRKWSQEDQNFASGVATQVALAYERDYAKRAQENLMQRSLHDPDTHLPNCVHFDDALDTQLRLAASGTLILVASIDQYTYMLGGLGLQRMQALLKKFAEQLYAVTSRGAAIARIASNEYAVAIPNVEHDAVTSFVQAWTAGLKTPLMSGDRKLFLTLSAGYTYWDAQHQGNAEAARTEAHLARLDARQEGGDRTKSFMPEMRQRLISRASIEQDLRRALDEREFVLHFQPIVHLATGRCTSVEALLRWRHPQRGLVMPSEFMPVALDSGVMLELGRRVLRAACDGITQLRKQNNNDALVLSLNMSAPEILLPGTVDAIKEELQRVGLSPSALTIEITESALLMDLDRACDALREIRACGAKVALDDFGTAFSSLSWLRNLPIDVIKIDRSFVAGIANDHRDWAIVKSIVGLAKAFDQVVIAEGIESQEQCHMLRTLGLEYGQGFLFSQAEPVERLSTIRLNAMLAPASRV
jgi:EAL domain-containing protein (putative c-di-GMP-specific phosphodiesterase class I)/GGDEF domain-containing protein